MRQGDAGRILTLNNKQLPFTQEFDKMIEEIEKLSGSKGANIIDIKDKKTEKKRPEQNQGGER